MLAKMGFKEGEGLGKTNPGIKEPIPMVIKQGFFFLLRFF